MGHQNGQGIGAHDRTGQEERLGELALFREGKGRSYRSLQLTNGKLQREQSQTLLRGAQGQDKRHQTRVGTEKVLIV